MEHLDLLTMATNAGGIPEGRQSVRLRTEHLHHLATRIIRAAGAVRTQIEPVPIARGDQGYFYHPALPGKLSDGFRLDWFAYANGLEAKPVAMDEDELTQEALDRYQSEDSAGDFSGWTPRPPTGKGWFCLAIYDTEDGPQAVFVRQPRQQEPSHD